MAAFDVPQAVALLLFLWATWQWPFEALGFVVAGAIPYYAALHLFGMDPSAEMTGGLFGGAGAVAGLRLLVRPGRGKEIVSSPYVHLFVLFVVVWYFRWISDPMVGSRLHQMTAFAARAKVLMLAYCCVPFIAGLAVRGTGEVMRVLRAVAVFGAASAAVMMGYWAAGAPHLGSKWLDKWEPIPNLTGIAISLELGLGLLACLAVAESAHRLRFARWLLVLPVLALQIRVGQRGPFMFLLLALFAYIALRERRAAVRAAAGTAAALSAVAVVVMQTTVQFGESRATALSGYTEEGNQDRLQILQTAARLVVERPLDGWGASLLGRPLGGDVWDYSHMMFLDPLLEAGLVGAIPLWSLYIILALKTRRSWTLSPLAREQLRIVVVPFAYLILEAQVSGHVSAHKHVWLFTGLLCGLGGLAPRRQRLFLPAHVAVPAPVSLDGARGESR